jgi:hypothetical protein
MTKSNKKKSAPQGAYAVGYAKPPKNTQFAKGKSGNPSGRPKGSKKGLAAELQPVFDQKVNVVINGKAKKVNVMEAIGTKVLAMAMAGNPAAVRLAIDLYQVVNSANDNGPMAAGSSFELSADDLAVIEKSALFKGLL